MIAYRSNLCKVYRDKKIEQWKKLPVRLFQKDLLDVKQFLALNFFWWQRHFISWHKPRTFSEKAQWSKLYYRPRKYTDIVDKIKFKEFVAERVGDKYVIPTLAVWDTPEQMDFTGLPKKFVVKYNHCSGGTYIHTGKREPDVDEVKKIMSGYSDSHYKRAGEWIYKDVEMKLFAEMYLDEDSELGIPDYKFYCFDGVPLYIQINSFRRHYYFDEEKPVVDYQVVYDMDWNRQPFTIGYPRRNDIDIPKPANFDEMKAVAAKLSQGMPYARVDLYNIKGHIYAGEITFYPYSGFHKIRPRKWDFKLGELFKLGTEK